MSQRFISRRQTLRGAGGVAVGLPLLPSLLPRNAAAAPPGPPRLVLMTQKQGGYGPFLHDDVSDQLPNKASFAPGHEFAWGPLPKSTVDGRTQVTRILRASSAALSDKLLAKMNVMRGLDSVSRGGHHTAMFAGEPEYGLPSIDQLVAWSPSFYKGAFRERAIVAGYASASFYHSNPATRSGPVQGVDSIGNPQKLWDRVFGGDTPPPREGAAPAGPSRPPLVDAVLGHYKLIRDSNRRVSAEDKRRLDGHMQMLSELQRRVSASPVSAMCEKPTRTSKSFGYAFVKESGGITTPPEHLRSPAESIELHQLYNQIVAAAFMCGITNVATIFPYEKNDPFSTYKDNWHTLAHQAGLDSPETRIMADSYQSFFEGVVVDLARRLDVPEVDGRTYLDDTLIVWTNEHAEQTHNAMDKMLVTFGSARGYFKTGQWLDMRNRAKLVAMRGKTTRYYAGITMNQFWANVLGAMGIPRTEWQGYAKGGAGYGVHTVQNQGGSGRYALTADHYLQAVFDRAGEKLPQIT